MYELLADMMIFTTLEEEVADAESKGIQVEVISTEQGSAYVRLRHESADVLAVWFMEEPNATAEMLHSSTDLVITQCS